MSLSLAAIIGIAVGGLGLTILIGVFCTYLIIYCKNTANKNSESSSSEPPTQGGRDKGVRGSSTEHQMAREFTLEELEQATKNFSENNLIGEGSFGLVYKGLLCDGTVVAVKMRHGSPKVEFVEEVMYISSIWHRNLVTLVGYCQEAGLQMLVFEYVPNGSLTGHLYGSEKESTRLEFKRRLSAAIGAAKGLSHLHRLVPPLIHQKFKTNNVLVDENFISKVADAGIVRLLQRIEDAGPSQISNASVFQDPEIGKSEPVSEASDVYSFGVFLLELISGQEAERIELSVSTTSLAQWAEAHIGADTFIDRRMHKSYTSEGMRDMVRLMMRCLSLHGVYRPRMENVVLELERILETEMALTTFMGDTSTIVTLGSQLFTSG